MLKTLDNVLKWLGLAWSLAAFVGAIAFFGGGEWRDWQLIKERVITKDWSPPSKIEISLLRDEIQKLQNRINGIKLTATDQDIGEYGCAGTSKAEPTTTVVMYGLRDGTSCNASNLNYYKKLEIQIPQN